MKSETSKCRAGFVTGNRVRADSTKPNMGLTMKDWISKLHAFLTINDRNIITHAGKVSHEMARELAEAEYELFNRKRIQQADAAGGEFEKAVRQLPPSPKPKKKGGKK